VRPFMDSWQNSAGEDRSDRNDKKNGQEKSPSSDDVVKSLAAELRLIFEALYGQPRE
jgi:hypothetical protein